MGSTDVAIVTGAASGIGYATVRQLLADGWRVAAADRNADRLERTARLDAGILTMALDVRDTAAVTLAAGTVTERLGTPSLLVNVAGVGVAATVTETSDADWDRILGTNLTAVFQLCRVVLPAMLAAGHGIIVNVASVAGMVGVRNRAAYCASKAGVIGLTKSIAVDYAGQGIRANAICPGTVGTEWIDKILANAPDPDAARQAMEQRQLDGRMGSPEEVAAGIGFLASPQGRFVNGSAFVMDGGMTAL